jgi:hypothetical protein
MNSFVMCVYLFTVLLLRFATAYRIIVPIRQSQLQIHYLNTNKGLVRYNGLILHAADGKEAADAEKKRILDQARAQYEERLQKSAEQYTKTQAAFFSVAKFLMPVIIAVWGYTYFSGTH